MAFNSKFYSNPVQTSIFFSFNKRSLTGIFMERHFKTNHDDKICLAECPEEVVDNRSLFERLQEQKDKKELEFQESISFSKYILDCTDKKELEFQESISFSKYILDCTDKKELEFQESISFSKYIHLWFIWSLMDSGGSHLSPLF